MMMECQKQLTMLDVKKRNYKKKRNYEQKFANSAITQDTTFQHPSASASI